MRTVILWKDDAISDEELQLAVVERKLYGRTLTSSCKIYKKESQLMLTAPPSYSRPWSWVQRDGEHSQLELIHQANTDEAAVDETGKTYLLDFEVKGSANDPSTE